MEAYIREEFDEIRHIMKETEELRKESEKERKESEKDRKEDEKSRKEDEKSRKKSAEDFDRRMIESEEKRKKYAEDRKEAEEDFNRRMKKLGELVGSYGNNLGDIAEDFFGRTLEQVPRLGNIEFEQVQRNLRVSTKKKLRGEYDVVLFNGDSVGVVEVKSKLLPKDVKKFLEVNLPKFRDLFPRLQNFHLYGAVAGMAIPPEVQEMAEKAGLFVLTQAQDQLICTNPPEFQAREF